MKYTEYLEVAIKASIHGGRKIMEVYESCDYEVEHKADDSPLTRADMLSHQIIKDSLKITTGLPLLSEEGKNISYPERKDWPLFWLVDPLDGTKEFIKRNGEFTVNIALIEKGRPVMGIIYVPASGRLYLALEGMGAFRSTYNAHIFPDDFKLMDFITPSMKIIPPVNKVDKPVIIASRSHLSDETKAFIGKAKIRFGEIETVSIGSSLKFCMLAEGQATIYPRFAPTMEWDTAAGQAIVSELGYETIVPDTGKPLVYNKENLLNPWFIVKPRGFEV